jgi:polyhydroxyalkanoate synthesis regulator phasin
MMNERRKEVLQMLAAGKITADEAERLIAALENDKQPMTSGSDANSEAVAKAKPKYLRVVVDAQGDSELGHAFGGSKHGPTHVNIRVPMQLLRAGVKLASLIPPQAQVYVNDALREKGVTTIDLSQLKPENLEELIDGLSDMTVDVVDKDAKVAVFCE